jgi:hypothetical protein
VRYQVHVDGSVDFGREGERTTAPCGDNLGVRIIEPATSSSPKNCVEISGPSVSHPAARPHRSAGFSNDSVGVSASSGLPSKVKAAAPLSPPFFCPYCPDRYNSAEGKEAHIEESHVAKESETSKEARIKPLVRIGNAIFERRALQRSKNRRFRKRPRSQKQIAPKARQKEYPLPSNAVSDESAKARASQLSRPPSAKPQLVSCPRCSRQCERSSGRQLGAAPPGISSSGRSGCSGADEYETGCLKCARAAAILESKEKEERGKEEEKA